MSYLGRVKEPISIKIADIVRQEIMTDTYKKGEHIRETVMAEHFGVSRGPIREALLILKNEGLVTSLPNGRVIVNGFSLDDMKAFYQMRCYIETEAVKKILSNPLDDSYYEWVNELGDMVRESNIYLDRATNVEYTELDLRFHLAIVEKADCGLYTQMWSVLSNYSRSIMGLNRQFLLGPQSKSGISEERYQELLNDQSHALIVKGLSEGNLEYTIENIKRHVEKGIDLYTEIFKHISITPDQ